MLGGEGLVRAGRLAQGRPGAADRRHGDPADPDQRQAARGNHRAEGHGRGEVEKLALADEAVVKFLAGSRSKKLIVVPGRIVNVVI